MTVSLILPTIARPSLRLMLASLVDAAPEVGAGGGRGRPLPAVRAMVDESGVAGTRCLHVFRVMPAAGFMVPQDEERRLRLGFVDIDGVVVPRSVARRCRFGAQYTGDYDFIVAGAGALAAQPAWHGDVISVNQGWADRRGVTRLE